MGFIDKLRQLVEIETLAKNQKEADLRRKEDAEKDALQKRVAQEKALHERRKQEAASFLQESGVEVLLSDLRKILQDSGKLCDDTSFDGNPAFDINPDLKPNPRFAHSVRYLSGILSKDPSSALASTVCWDTRVIRKDENARGGTIDRYEGKFLVTEVVPEGDIIFHANRDVIVPMARWRSNRGIIESSLEAAFNHARFIKFRSNFQESPNQGHD